ncbi:hypothetical protein CDAR_184371 [Caerostris darwini]|uniref:Uncharacterized protein n=1 Tax=Caerostris darwini TaxID=1538125 RepID=A0AAV4UG48_9ARAC|nr:hypothetical protein CDAR_184371 [Caerostris darwini]
MAEEIFFCIVCFGLKGKTKGDFRKAAPKSRLFRERQPKGLVGSSIFPRRTYQHSRNFSHKGGPASVQGCMSPSAANFNLFTFFLLPSLCIYLYGWK